MAGRSGTLAPMPKRSTAARTRPRGLDLASDGEILSAGRTALEKRLGLAGMLRFLRLVGGSRDRFEDLRKAWVLEGAQVRRAIRRQGERHAVLVPAGVLLLVLDKDRVPLAQSIGCVVADVLARLG